MIKRDGVDLMNERTLNVKIAKENIKIFDKGNYQSPNGQTVDLESSLDFAIDNTVYYPDPLPRKDYTKITPIIEVTNETTTQAARRLQAAGKENVVVLNFASARNQGGGFLAGALAQEECLCRESGLYACLKRKPMFYNTNIMCDDPYYTDGIIYSPKVPFFRDSNNLLMEEPYFLSVISAPAPNLSGSKPEGLSHLLKGIIRERSLKILEVAEAHGHQNIVLGAWGCGAFGNDPKMIADAFALALEKVPTFEHVCFAVYDTREPPVLYEAFKKTF